MTAKTHSAGLEPATFGFKVSELKNLTALGLTSYNSPKNHFTTNLTENVTTIQQNLTKIIGRWPSLPLNIKAAIMTLIGGDDDEEASETPKKVSRYLGRH